MFVVVTVGGFLGYICFIFLLNNFPRISCLEDTNFWYIFKLLPIPKYVYNKSKHIVCTNILDITLKVISTNFISTKKSQILIPFYLKLPNKNDL